MNLFSGLHAESDKVRNFDIVNLTDQVFIVQEIERSNSVKKYLGQKY